MKTPYYVNKMSSSIQSLGMTNYSRKSATVDRSVFFRLHTICIIGSAIIVSRGSSSSCIVASTSTITSTCRATHYVS